MQHNIAEKFWYLFSIAGLILVYILGLNIDIMDVDAAQYASISREMSDNGSFFQVLHRGKDYLDKPPLLFWLSSLSFSIFGISNWAYKLPSFLSTLLGIFSLYRFTKLFYSKDTARTTALIFATCQALFLINNDVRTDTLLTNMVIFTVWQMTAYLKNPKALYFIGSSIGLALAMMAKGPLGLMVPVLAFGSHFVIRGEWKEFIRPAWYGMILLSLFLLTPMIWGLYEQHGSYGPYFFFWEQSFGRLTGQNAFIQSQEIPQQTDPFFFVHTFLWSFLPFSLWAVFGVFRKVLNIIAFKQRNTPNREMITLGAFVLPFIALSFSEYKLPHYIFSLYPFAAVLTARFFMLMVEKNRPYWQRSIWLFQGFVSLAMLGIAIYIGTYFFGNAPIYLFVIFGLFGALSILAFFSSSTSVRIIFPSVLAIIAANIIVSGHFYPELTKYQGTKAIAEYLKENNIPSKNFYTYKTHYHSLDFYTESIVEGIYNENSLKNWNRKAYMLVPENELKDFSDASLNYKTIEQFQYYPITLLRKPFLNPETRQEKVEKLELIKIE